MFLKFSMSSLLKTKRAAFSLHLVQRFRNWGTRTRNNTWQAFYGYNCLRHKFKKMVSKVNYIRNNDVICIALSYGFDKKNISGKKACSHYLVMWKGWGGMWSSL